MTDLDSGKSVSGLKLQIYFLIYSDIQCIYTEDILSSSGRRTGVTNNITSGPGSIQMSQSVMMVWQWANMHNALNANQPSSQAALPAATASAGSAFTIPRVCHHCIMWSLYRRQFCVFWPHVHVSVDRFLSVCKIQSLNFKSASVSLKMDIVRARGSRNEMVAKTHIKPKTHINVCAFPTVTCQNVEYSTNYKTAICIFFWLPASRIAPQGHKSFTLLYSSFTSNTFTDTTQHNCQSLDNKPDSDSGCNMHTAQFNDTVGQLTTKGMQQNVSLSFSHIKSDICQHEKSAQNKKVYSSFTELWAYPVTHQHFGRC